MKSDLREFVVMERVIHEPARLLIITLLYPVAKAGNRGVRRAGEEIQRQVPHDYLQPYKKKGRAAIADYAEKLKSLTNATYDVIQNKP